MTFSNSKTTIAAAMLAASSVSFIATTKALNTPANQSPLNQEFSLAIGKCQEDASSLNLLIKVEISSNTSISDKTQKDIEELVQKTNIAFNDAFENMDIITPSTIANRTDLPDHIKEFLNALEDSLYENIKTLLPEGAIIAVSSHIPDQPQIIPSAPNCAATTPMKNLLLEDKEESFGQSRHPRLRAI